MGFRENLEALGIVPAIAIKQLGHAVAPAKVLVGGLSFWLPVPKT